MAASPDRADTDVELPLLHERSYKVRAFRRPDGRLLLRGTVVDDKPPGVLIADDPDPVTIHEMEVELVVDLQTFVIVDANVVMEVHPHLTCTTIVDHYDKLVGLSISRGFISKVRELFGGPRGCTHIAALLMAMAPVVVQSLWTVRVASDQVAAPRRMTDAERRVAAAVNIGSCHVWAEDGELAAMLAAGGEPPIPLWVEQRLRERGLDPSMWRPRAR